MPKSKKALLDYGTNNFNCQNTATVISLLFT